MFVYKFASVYVKMTQASKANESVPECSNSKCFTDVVTRKNMKAINRGPIFQVAKFEKKSHIV